VIFCPVGTRLNKVSGYMGQMRRGGANVQ
jgi:hypothetical protein